MRCTSSLPLPGVATAVGPVLPSTSTVSCSACSASIARGGRSFDGYQVSVNGTRSPFVHGELAERAQVLAAMLDGRAEAERRPGPATAMRPSADPPDPGDRAAVVEADDELGEHLDVAAQPFDDAHDVRRLSARWHEVDHAHGAGVRFPLGLQDERARAIAGACPPTHPIAARGASVRAPACRAAPRSRRRSRSAGSTPSRSSRRARRAPRSAGRRSGRSPRSAPSAVLDLEREAPEASQHGLVEGLLVLLGRILLERRREVVTKVGQDLGPRLDEVDVVAVALLRLVAWRLVVRPLGRDTVFDEPALLAFEDVELAIDELRETCAPEPSQELLVEPDVRIGRCVPRERVACTPGARPGLLQCRGIVEQLARGIGERRRRRPPARRAPRRTS